MSTYNHDETLTAALAAFESDDLEVAAELAKLATHERPNDAEGWSVLGLAISGAEGLQYLRKATEMEPNEPRWQLHLGNGLTAREDHIGAETVYAHAAQLSRGHPDAMKAWGSSLLTLQRYREAVRVFQRVVQLQPSTEVWMKAGDALMGAKDTINAAKAYEQAHTPEDRPLSMSGKLADLNLMLAQYDEAEVFIRAILKVEPHNPDGGLRLADLMRWRGEHEEALRIQQEFWGYNPAHSGLISALLDDGDDRPLEAAIALVDDEVNDLQGRRRVSFALARHYDRAKNEAQAWNYAVKANDFYDDDLEYDGGEMHRMQLRKAIAAYEQLPDPAPQSQKMIYVIGPPRCGGSLLQTILTQPQGMVSVGERGALMGWIIPALENIDGLTETLPQLAIPDLAGMVKAAGAGDIYVDKTSPHIVIAGLLAKVHHGAKFVLPKRSHNDMIVSMYFHDFPPDFVYTRSVNGIRDYLAFQDEAASAWREAGLEIIDHDHDAFVQNPENIGQALFNALALPWNADVLDTNKSDAVVRTFSSRQVRGGVSKKYAGRGERYAKYLTPK